MFESQSLVKKTYLFDFKSGKRFIAKLQIYTTVKGMARFHSSNKWRLESESGPILNHLHVKKESLQSAD